MPVEGSGAIAPARLCANREERNGRPEEELRLDHQALCAWARRHRRWRRRPRRGQLLRQQVRAHHLHLSRPEGLRGQGDRRRHRGQPVLQVVLRQLGRAPGGRCPGCPRGGPGGFRPSQERRRAAPGRGQGDALRCKLGLHPLWRRWLRHRGHLDGPHAQGGARVRRLPDQPHHVELLHRGRRKLHPHGRRRHRRHRPLRHPRGLARALRRCRGAEPGGVLRRRHRDLRPLRLRELRRAARL